MQFQRIAIYGKHRSERIADTLQTLIVFLKNQQCDITIEEQTATSLNNHGLPVVNYQSLGKDHDVIIVVGGDGSLLHAAHRAIEYDTPIIGINRGSLGFLTDILPQQLETQLPALLTGHYIEEHRFLLHAHIQNTQQETDVGIALNDVVLLPGKFSHMIRFETTINDQSVCQQRADGLIVCTPTGSTAYALSGGGPILHPTLDAIALVPMFPHTLSSRPIVVNATSTIKIHISEDNDAAPCVSYDGSALQAIDPGATLQIKKHNKQLKLLHPMDYNYYDTLREKLGWQR